MEMHSGKHYYVYNELNVVLLNFKMYGWSQCVSLLPNSNLVLLGTTTINHKLSHSYSNYCPNGRD